MSHVYTMKFRVRVFRARNTLSLHLIGDNGELVPCRPCWPVLKESGRRYAASDVCLNFVYI